MSRWFGSRNPALALGLFAALLNALVVVFGVQLTPDGILALNGTAFALVAFIANESDPSTPSVLSFVANSPASLAAVPAPVVPAPAVVVPAPALAASEPAGAAPVMPAVVVGDPPAA